MYGISASGLEEGSTSDPKRCFPLDTTVCVLGAVVVSPALTNFTAKWC